MKLRMIILIIVLFPLILCADNTSIKGRYIMGPSVVQIIAKAYEYDDPYTRRVGTQRAVDRMKQHPIWVIIMESTLVLHCDDYDTPALPYKTYIEENKTFIDVIRPDNTRVTVGYFSDNFQILYFGKTPLDKEK